MRTTGRGTRGLALGLLLLGLGCGGRAEDRGEQTPAPPAPTVNGPAAGSGTPDDEQSAGGRPAVNGQASPGEAPAPDVPEPACLGSLNELNAMGDVTCPSAWCEATDLARDCGSLRSTVSQISSSVCDQPDSVWRWWSIELQLASGEHKICRYVGGTFLPQGDPQLREIELSNTTASYCQGSSKRISTSAEPAACSGTPSVLCDASEPKPSANASAPPTRYSAWRNACVRSCPTQAPDCSVPAEAEHYTQQDMCAESTYCMCWCNAGEWQCGC